MSREKRRKSNYHGGFEMSKIAVTGDDAIAQAAKLVNPDVVAAYPITPQTIIVERFSDFVADGEVDTEFVCVESEHSAMSACIGASTAGGRVFTSSASAGLMLMYEILQIASSSRTPIVCAIANRAISGPINIHGEQTDQLLFRDSGWISQFAETNQEAYDQTIMAFKIGEHPEVLLPVAVGIDGFILSHAIEGVEPVTRELVSDFLGGERKSILRLDPDNPVSIGLLHLQDYYMEARAQVRDAQQRSKQIIIDTFKDWQKLTGREYNPIESYQMDDAEYAFVTMGSGAGNARTAIDELRANGEKVGLIKVRVYRPWFGNEFSTLTKNIKGIISVERAHSFGSPGGILGQDVKSTLFDSKQTPYMAEYCYGLGGRDCLVKEWTEIYNRSIQGFNEGENLPYFWWGVRE
ncbi:pyruvate ferredoxin oxidoreductase [Candidatus Heimdallarchaeota archaeon B3_Heim]|nr:MAG: pyruvate ferredoxin oxidoreductase [Candidatus Heimdallarchaeota archaeon B3_Heim]